MLSFKEINQCQQDLHPCPLDQYEHKTTRTFFELITNYQESCTAGKLFLGITPFEPVELAAGRYVLLLPVNYSWEHQGRIEASVVAGQKTFFLLKLFENYPTRGTGDVKGGSGTGGGPGSGAP